jgi:hypothetical protein
MSGRLRGSPASFATRLNNPQRNRAVARASPPAHAVPTPAEIDANRRASFAKLSAADQAVLLRFGAAPPGVTSSALPAPAQPALSDYDHGQLEAARLLGKSAPAPAGEISLAPGQADPDPRLDPAAMERGSVEARRLLGKSAA